YATAEELALDLERWRAGEVIPSPPPEALPAVVLGPEPAPPRRRYRWAFAAVLLLSTLGFSGLPSQPARPVETVVKRTIAQRLKAGETVVLVPEKGLEVPGQPVPGREGMLGLDRDGLATLTSPVFGAVELCNEELPWPIKLRAQYAVRSAQDSRSRGGVF